MDSNICVAVMDRFAGLVRSRDQHFLNERHIFGRNFHAQITPRHHDAIGDFHDFFDISDAGGILGSWQ